MSQKGIAPLLLILGLTVVLVVSALITFINFKKSDTPVPSASASPDSKTPQDVYYSGTSSDCGEEVKKQIRVRNIEDISQCKQRVFDIEGRQVIFGLVKYGKVTCNEVCTQPTSSFVIDGSSITDLMPFSSFDAEQKIYEKSGWLCQDVFNGFSTDQVENSAKLIRNGSSYAWEINMGQFSNPLCRFDGMFIQSDDTTLKGDLIISTHEIDCTNENQLKAICTKAGVSCKTELAEDYLCHYVKAQFGQELNTCDNPNVARVKCEQKYGNSSGKCTDDAGNKSMCILSATLQ